MRFLKGWGQRRGGNHSMIFMTWLRKLFLEGGGKLGRARAQLLFLRFTEFLRVSKNSKCKTSVIKLLKIAQISGLTKKGKNLESWPRQH